MSRLVFALGLLVVEYVVALFFFDSDRLPVGRKTNAFALLGESMPLVIVVMTATLLLGGGPSEDEKARISEAFSGPRRAWPWLVGHLLFYALALGVTILVFNARLELAMPWLWIAAWALATFTSVALLAVAMLPRAALRPLSKPVARALASGLVVGVLALLAGSATSALWRPMSRMTLTYVGSILGLVSDDVVAIPDELIVGLPGYEVFVDRPCSGYEGIGLVTVILGFYLFLFRKSLRFPNALLLLPIGVSLIWLANSVRIAALVMVGTWVSPEIAEGGFHSAAGWLLFCIVTLGLVAVSRQSSWLTRDARSPKGSFLTPEGAYLLPLLVLIGTALITALFATEFDYLYPLRVVTPLIPLWIFRRYYRDLRASWSWSPVVLGIVVFVFWVGLEPPPNPKSERLIPETLGQLAPAAAGLWLVARVVGSSVIVPIAEELAFRGYLLRRLIKADFTMVSPQQFTMLSFVGSSVAFGALHGRWLVGTLAGMVYAAAQYKRGEVADAIVAHSVTNALLAAYVLIFGAWWFW